MQKTNKKASILIWSIFLSLVVSLSFVFVSTKINQNIMLNMYLEDFFSKDNKIVALINSNTEWDIWNNETVKKDSSIFSLASRENMSFSFSWISDFTWSIRLKDWGPIYFEVISYSWSDLTTSSWILSDYTNMMFTWRLSTDYTKSELIIKNLWWISSFLLDVNKENTGTWNIKKYKVVKDIWWKYVEKSLIEN